MKLSKRAAEEEDLLQKLQESEERYDLLHRSSKYQRIAERRGLLTELKKLVSYELGDILEELSGDDDFSVLARTRIENVMRYIETKLAKLEDKSEELE